MALGPSITQTAGRGALPSARFDTRNANAADFGGQVGAAVADLGGAVGNVGQHIEQFEAAKLADHKRVENFTREANFVQFATDEQTRLTEASRDLQGSGVDFQKEFVLSHAASAQEFLTANGITDERDKAEWEPRLQRLRSGFSTEALGTEFKARDHFYNEQTNAALDTFAKGINQSPDAFESYRQNGLDMIEASGLSRVDKDTKALEWRRLSATAYGQALVQRDPSAAMRAMGGPVTEAGDYTGPTGAAKADFDFFRSQGLPAVAAAAVVGVLSWESGGGTNGINPNGRNRGDGNDGSDSIGAGQWNGARADALKAFAQAQGKPWNDKDVQLAFVMHEMKTTEPEAYRRLQSATTIEQAVEAMSYYERPQGWANGGDPTKVIHYAQRVERARHFAGGVATETRPPEGGVDPRLADLSYDQRMSLLGAADRGIQQEQQQVARAQQAQYANQLNDLHLKLMDGTAGAADIENARKTWLTDAGDVAALTNVVEAKAKENADINLFDSLISSNATWNPADENQRKAVDAGYARSGGGIGMVQNIVDRTGIVPTAAGAQIRGGLLSTNPEQVKAAASVASNLITRSPNALAFVSGHEDIEKAGVMFDHLVNDLGYTADEAAGRVARSNDPTQRNAVPAPAVQAFRTELAKENPGEQLRRDEGGGFLGFGRAQLSEQQQAVVGQDYRELAANHYERFGDAGAARAFAQQRLGRLYGVSNGALIKYPPESAYPAVGGSHDYIYAQASAAATHVAGHAIPADQIRLMPLPTVTAEAWRRADPSRPPPYQIQYVDKVDGQDVYHVIPRGFIATPRAHAPTVKTNRADFERRRLANEAARRAASPNGTGAFGLGN